MHPAGVILTTYSVVLISMNYPAISTSREFNINLKRLSLTRLLLTFLALPVGLEISKGKN